MDCRGVGRPSGYLCVADAAAAERRYVAHTATEMPVRTTPPSVSELEALHGSNKIQFEVKRGHTFRFDYWGP